MLSLVLRRIWPRMSFSTSSMEAGTAKVVCSSTYMEVDIEVEAEAEVEVELEMEVELDLALAPHEAPPVQVEGVAPYQARHPRVPAPHLGAPLTGCTCGGCGPRYEFLFCPLNIECW